MKVRFTTEAKADMRQIGDYIARGSRRRALSFIDELEQKSLAIAASPKAFPLIPGYEWSGIRRRVYGSYLIFYQVEDGGIFILRILHGSTDYAYILFEA